MDGLLVLLQLINLLLRAPLHPLRVLVDALVGARAVLGDALAREGPELLLALLLAYAFLARLDLVLERLLHVLNVVVCLLGDLGQLDPLLLLQLPQFVLLGALVRDLLLFELVCDLLQPLGHKLINC